jgi:lipopolysaccharide export system permease protein|tara:strand:+ start:69092 stop:70192 length:1101 start_codon:yes stop_codon:yes gene_type:complete
MMRPWPSNTLALYQARMFAIRIVAFAFVLVGILQMLDLLSESEKILAVSGNGNAELWQYVQLRAPQLVDTFLPFSVLLGALVTWASLSTSSEIVIMKGAGLSPHKILLPMMATALLVSVAHFVFSETVLPQTNARLDAWQGADYGVLPADPGTARFDEWQIGDSDILFAEQVEGAGADMVLTGVTVYRRSANGADLVAIANGPRAVPVADGWQLDDTRSFNVAAAQIEEIGPMIVGRGIAPARYTVETPDPDESTTSELAAAIERLEAAGRPTDALHTAFMHKFSAPLSALLMPLLGAVAGFGLARSGQLFKRTVIGLVLGFAYFVADNAMLAMGQFGAAPPILAAWGPFLMFFLVGEAVLFRTEE